MDEQLDDRIAALDPTMTDPPPAPGSDRYRRIQEKAMQITTHSATAPADEHTAHPAPTAAPAGPRRRGPQRWLAAAAIAAVAATGTAVVLGGTDAAPAGAEAIRSAAASLGEVDEGRGTLVQVYPDGEVWTFDAEFDGRDTFQSATSRARDGEVLASWEITSVGTRVVTVEGDVVQEETLEPGQLLEPFATSSAALLEAALDGGDVTDLGVGIVRGVEAQHYQIQTTSESRSALAGLAPGQRSWFGLEDPAEVTAIQVWVADGVVRRIEVTFSADASLASSSTEFFDLGADISIEPPA